MTVENGEGSVNNIRRYVKRITKFRIIKINVF